MMKLTAVTSVKPNLKVGVILLIKQGAYWRISNV